MNQSDVLEHIVERERVLERPVVVGVSGYCGSGKSTLARSLVAALPDAVRMRGDDFLDPERSHRRSSDWDGVGRERLVATVLEPFRDERTSRFQRYDWARRALGPEEPLPQARTLVVDLIGLFHPEALPTLDVTVWCDVDLDTAARRGVARDRRLGRSHDALWHDIWLPNERDFEQRFTPRHTADLLSAPSSRPIVQRNGSSASSCC
ncbi:uridine kinase family protein [Curtobacterium aetherium]|uniref:Phosphoglycerate transporter n=1 Tax=Curtobacterium aetherium TaxID=2841594 RepID=A0ACD1E5C2_9MICO|nr:phosphoglycerate transporter [Curtobacterium sp. L6-1]QWS33944.1 phosphoglycerate transporter [Curtobacterium sp. L6-1]